MDGVHDLGGKLGFGPIEVADEGSPFHGAWEGRMMGIARAISRPPDWNIDKFRHSRELEAPVLYLTRPYYDQWYKAYACMLVGSGVVTLDELASGKSDGSTVTGMASPMSADEVPEAKRHGAGFDRPYDGEPRFSVGEAVLTRNVSPVGHTRLPAYARGRSGVITATHGAHVLPDAAAHGEPRAEPLYTVRFRLSDLFPERQGSLDQVHLDLWQSYLDADR